MKKKCKKFANFVKKTNKTLKLLVTTWSKLKKIWIPTTLCVLLGLSSCTFTRSVTTESSSYQRGDTAVIIQSKTIETYHAKKETL